MKITDKQLLWLTCIMSVTVIGSGLASLLLPVSCSGVLKPNRDYYESLLITDESTGKKMTQEDFDKFMGRSDYRDIESMMYSTEIMEKPYEILEIWALDQRTGAQPVIIDTSDLDGMTIARLMKRYGGNYFSGRIWISTWAGPGGYSFKARRENIYWDREYGKFISGWSSGDAPRGYETRVVYDPDLKNGGEEVIGGPAKVHGGPEGLYYASVYYESAKTPAFRKWYKAHIEPPLREDAEKFRLAEPSEIDLWLPEDHPDPILEKRIIRTHQEAPWRTLDYWTK